MKITLHNFMKHEDLDITLNKGELTLISGDSEAGKSSILYAIYWCLYGKVQKVYRDDISKVYVQIELPNIIIYRQARPGSIKVIVGNKTIKGIAAQKIIDQHFHNKDVWKACSLVEQKKECFLLESNYKNRLHILSDLTFDEDDPKVYIKKIENYQSKTKIKYLEAMTEFHVLERQYMNLNDKKYEIPGEDLEKHKESLCSNKKKFLLLEKEKNNLAFLKREQEDLEHLLRNLNQQKKSSLKSKLTLGPSIDLEKLKLNLDNLRERFKSNSSLQLRVNSYNKIKARLDNLPNTNLELAPELITEKYFYEIKNSETEYLRNTKLAKKHLVSYETDAINKKIKDINIAIDEHNIFHPLINVLSELERLETKNKGIIVKDVSPEEINKQKDLHQEMKKERELLKCPWCIKSVYYKNSILIKSDKVKITEKQLEEQFQKVKLLVTEYKNKVEYDKIQSKIYSLVEKLGSVEREKIKNHLSINIRKNYSIINELEQIKILSPPKYSSSNIRLFITKKELTDTINSEYSDLGDIVVNITKKEVDTKLREYKVAVKREEKRKELDITIKLLETQIIKIKIDPDIKLQYEKVDTSINKIINDINNESTYIADQEQLILLDKALISTKILSSKLDSIQSLKEKVINLSCDLLENTVNQIGESSTPILRSIFEKSVVLELKLFKELKGKKVKGQLVTKQMVNLDVYFDSKKHDKRMCWGEKDRISIALLIALNNYSRSPFLLMDELLGTVSSPIAEKCIKQIKKYIKNKYVICIEHNAVHGRYDRVITL